VQARRRPLHCAFGSIPRARMLQALGVDVLKTLEVNMEEDQNKSKTRMGVDYDLEGIDPQYVESFAKIYRIVGLIITIVFVIWGVSYDWSYSDSPFESLADAFGASSRNEGLYSIFIAIACLAAGYYFRFTVGAAFGATFFKVWDIIRSIFKRI